MKEYNKLVRDKIPEILDSLKLPYEIRTLDDNEYGIELSNKLVEEAIEFNQVPSISELADVLEVFQCLCKHYNVPIEKVEEYQRQKRETNGGFDKKIYLIRAPEK